MALQGLSPFGAAGLLDAQPAGHQGRDPLQWGGPQNQAHGQPAPAAAQPVFIPGAEFGEHGGPSISVEYVPGAGEVVGVPVTGYLGPADPRWQDWQEEITAARSEGTHDAPWRTDGRNLDDGRPLPTSRQLQVTDVTDLRETSGAFTVTRDIWRAIETVVHNGAKLLNGPWIDYSERPFYSNVAIVAPQSDRAPDYALEGTGRQIGSASNRYRGGGGLEAVQDPGAAIAYAPPAESRVVPDTDHAVAAPPAGAEWLTYG